MFQSPAIDLSPRAVAEYLILTGDFTGFDLALFDLIRARVVCICSIYLDFSTPVVIGATQESHLAYMRVLNSHG